MTERELRNLARAVCTPDEYDAWRLHRSGMSFRYIALATPGASHAAIHRRATNARRKIAAALLAAQEGPTCTTPSSEPNATRNTLPQ